MNREEPINPQLADLFDTVLSKAKQAPEAEAPPPRIVVNGSHNVVAFGGTVYVGDRQAAQSRED